MHRGWCKTIRMGKNLLAEIGYEPPYSEYWTSMDNCAIYVPLTNCDALHYGFWSENVGVSMCLGGPHCSIFTALNPVLLGDQLYAYSGLLVPKRRFESRSVAPKQEPHPRGGGNPVVVL